MTNTTTPGLDRRTAWAEARGLRPSAKDLCPLTVNGRRCRRGVRAWKPGVKPCACQVGSL